MLRRGEDQRCSCSESRQHGGCNDVEQRTVGRWTQLLAEQNVWNDEVKWKRVAQWLREHTSDHLLMMYDGVSLSEAFCFPTLCSVVGFWCLWWRACRVCLEPERRNSQRRARFTHKVLRGAVSGRKEEEAKNNRGGGRREEGGGRTSCLCLPVVSVTSFANIPT